MSATLARTVGLAALGLACLALSVAGFGGCSRPPKTVEGYVAAGTGPFSSMTLFPAKGRENLPPPAKPIAGATVSLLEPDRKTTGHSMASRADGAFWVGDSALSDTPGNVYILRVEAPGYVTLEQPVVIDKSAVCVIVTLVPEGPAPADTPKP